jgi:hypothetical protein
MENYRPKMVIFVRDEFIDLSGEERYRTESWIQAEREATEAHRRGGLKFYDSVDAMMDDILEFPPTPLAPYPAR